MRQLKRYIDTKYAGNISSFARAFSFGPGRVYHWLKGRRYPDRHAAIKISRRTAIPLDVLLGLNGKRRNNR